jgi:nucleoside-diphosphate-sugar epimerase
LVTADRESEDAAGKFAERIERLGCDVVVDLICFTPESARQMVSALRDRVGLFVHCGTLWVHGAPRSRPYDETAPREPFGDYGIRKAAIEKLLLEEAVSGFPATILHPGHITGPGWNPINPAGNLDTSVFARLGNGEEVTLPDDGEATLQHVHADDVAQAFELAIEKSGVAVAEAFHVASRLPITMRRYAETVASWSGREANLRFLPWDQWRKTVSERNATLTLDHVRHSPCASIAKAERLLGFAPRYTAAEAVRDALQVKPPQTGAAPSS